MAQLTIYLDESTLKKIEKAAREEKSSISKWAKKRLAYSLESKWPEGYFKVFGCLSDEEFERPAQLGFEADCARERL